MADTLVKYGISLENGTPTLDFTIDPVDNGVITAADTFSMLLPAGTVLNGLYSVITTAKGTSPFVGTVSIGVTNHATDILSGGTPSTTVGGTICGTGTTTNLGISGAATYLILTVNSTNAASVTGKLKAKVGLGLSSGQIVVL